MKSIFFIATVLLLSDCVSINGNKIDVGPTPGAGILAAVDDVQKKSLERDTARKGSIRIQCAAIYPGDSTESSAPCAKIYFSLVDLDKKTEGPRKFPDPEGKVELSATGGTQFGIRPGVEKKVAFTFEPARSFYQAGDTVRVLIRYR